MEYLSSLLCIGTQGASRILSSNGKDMMVHWWVNPPCCPPILHFPHRAPTATTLLPNPPYLHLQSNAIMPIAKLTPTVVLARSLASIAATPLMAWTVVTIPPAASTRLIWYHTKLSTTLAAWGPSSPVIRRSATTSKSLMALEPPSMTLGGWGAGGGSREGAQGAVAKEWAEWW